MAAANNYSNNSNNVNNNNNNNNNNKETTYMMHSATAHDWEEEKNRNKEFTDDGTMTFFWNAHNMTVLVIFSCILVYVTLFEEVVYDSEYNKKRGITAAVLAFLLFGVTQTPDGPFRRPHPAFWRLVLVLSIVYELALVYMLFQTVDDARQLLVEFDERLGKELPEKSYGGNCLIYDTTSSQPFHNLLDKFDGFVPVHFFGWWIKTLVLRDYWLCLVLSIMFEILEYTLEHQLPNFSECWWDHWIMDAVICNGAGIYLGMKTLRYLSLKPYHWRGMWDIPSYSGKMKRFAQQFTPYRWTDFEWKPLSSFKRWISMLAVITIFLIAELNTFYLKFVLWIPPDHYLCLGRLVFFILIGATSMREGFQFLDDPNCHNFGRQAWMCLSITLTELLIVIKFDWETVSKPLPKHIAYFWIIGFASLVLWTIWRFLIKRDVKNDVPEFDSNSDSKSSIQKQKRAAPKNSNLTQLRQRSQKTVVDR